MGLTFANPLGFLALLGIPAVLAIHLLQRRARLLPVSTLFLLEQLRRDSEGGNRIERLRASLPLWLQLLMVLVLTWLLVQPRWLEENSVQRIVLVLDGSASMTVARPEVEKALPADLRKLAAATARTEYYLLDSRMDSGHLYHGLDAAALMESLAKWQPSAGSHDPGPALRLARSLAGRDGLVLFVTDHQQEELPLGAQLYACGRPVANAGVAGVTVDEADGRIVWRATLRNYSDIALTRTWQVEAGGKASAPQSITLEPGQVRQVQGPFPDGEDAVTIALAADEFPLDDRAPVLRPRPRPVRVRLPVDEAGLPAGDSVYPAVFLSLPAVSLTTDTATTDVAVAHYNPLNPALPEQPACIFVRDPRPKSPVLTGTLLAERHPLMDGLNWQSLICEETLRLPLRESDEVLLWQGDRALIFLRGPDTRRQLCFNFDLRKSNARKLPGFVIVIHRFMELVRRHLTGEEWANVECGQKLPVTPASGENVPPLQVTTLTGPGTTGDTSEVPLAQAPLIRAPDLPGFLDVRQGDNRLLHAAAHFADVRECDFRQAATARNVSAAASEITRRTHREDPAWRLWMLLLLALLLGCWFWLARPTRGVGASA